MKKIEQLRRQFMCAKGEYEDADRRMREASASLTCRVPMSMNAYKEVIVIHPETGDVTVKQTMLEPEEFECVCAWFKEMDREV